VLPLQARRCVEVLRVRRTTCLIALQQNFPRRKEPMDLKSYLLAQLDREAAQTRKTIARVADPQSDFKPHERSMALGYLAALVGTMPGWIALMIDRDELNLDDPASEGFRTKVRASQADLLAAHDAAVADARRALESTTDEHLLTPWAFKM